MPPTITATDHPLEKLTGDAVVVAVGKGPDGLLPTPGAEAVDRLLGGRLLPALIDLGARGAEDEVTRLPSFGQGPFAIVAVAGLGSPDAAGAYPTDALRRAAGAASRALGGRRSVVSLLAAVGGTPDAERLHAVGEGHLLGAYEFTAYKSDLPADRLVPPSEFTVVVPTSAAAEAALRRVRAVADAVALVRDLVNTPPNDLYPAELAARGAAAGEKAGLTAEILDEDALAAGGYGGILAVGSGSTRKPRLLRLTYSGSGARKKVALVGKGITFDSGGLSIKPALKMEDMKSDMAGAAAVIATVCLVAQLGLPVEVIATVPIAENLPSGTAYRPADVVTFRNGKKAEITNTDAEGRVILADALARAAEDRPDVAARDVHPDRRAARGARHAHRRRHGHRRPARRRRRRRPPVRRGHVADAAAGRAAPGPGLPHRRLRQRQRRPHGRHAGRRALPRRVRARRAAVGAHRHRRAELQHRVGVGLHAQGRHRRPRPHPAGDDRGPDRRLSAADDQVS